MKKQQLLKERETMSFLTTTTEEYSFHTFESVLGEYYDSSFDRIQGQRLSESLIKRKFLELVEHIRELREQNNTLLKIVDKKTLRQKFLQQNIISLQLVIKNYRILKNSLFNELQSKQSQIHEMKAKLSQKQKGSYPISSLATKNQQLIKPLSYKKLPIKKSQIPNKPPKNKNHSSQQKIQQKKQMNPRRSKADLSSRKQNKRKKETSKESKINKFRESFEVLPNFSEKCTQIISNFDRVFGKKDGDREYRQANNVHEQIFNQLR